MTDQYHEWIRSRLEAIGEQWIDYKLADEGGRWYWPTTMKMLLQEIDVLKKQNEALDRSVNYR